MGVVGYFETFCGLWRFLKLFLVFGAFWDFCGLLPVFRDVKRRQFLESTNSSPQRQKLVDDQHKGKVQKNQKISINDGFMYVWPKNVK